MSVFPSDSDLELIHETTLAVLADPGVRFTEDAALSVFREAGFAVEGGVVRFRAQDVEDAIGKAPSAIVRRGIDPSCDVKVGDGGLSFAVGSLPLWVVDHETRQRRDATYRDMLDFVTLSDALDHFAIANAVVQPAEVPDRVMHAVWDQTIVAHTLKPACSWYAADRQTALDNVRIFEAAAGGREALEGCCTWSVTVCPSNALEWGKSVWGILEMAKAQIPISLVPTPFQGSMHPVTLAGALAQANAEALAGLVLTQLIRPGCPCIYAPSYGGIMDMSVGAHVFGTPEAALQSAWAARLGKWYGLPVDMMRGMADSKLPDAQAAYEKMMTLLLPALAGADCISQAGAMLGGGLLASFEQLLVDHEIVGQILHIMKGATVDTEHLALDVIRDVGIAGNYVEHEHTFRHFRDEMRFTEIADRGTWEGWTSTGGKSIVERASERWPEIVAAHARRGIPEDRQREVDHVVRDICDREGVRMTWTENA